MKQVIMFFLLVVFCTVSYPEKNEEDGLCLELKSNMRSLRLGQSVTVELKIIGQAIAEIIKNTNVIEPIYQKKPEFLHQFSIQPQKEGDCILGPYSLSFNGTNLESNSLTLKVLPEWDGGLGTIFRVDCNEIYLGESFELVMETWSKESTEFNISAIYNPELASIESGITRNKISIKNSEESHYFSKSWIITPKSRGDFFITKEFFREFPDDVEPPQLKIQVK